MSDYETYPEPVMGDDGQHGPSPTPTPTPTPTPKPREPSDG